VHQGRIPPWSCVVIKDKEVLNRLSKVAKANSLKIVESIPAFAAFRSRFANPEFHLFYHAPVMIIILGRKDNQIAVYDCTLAAENLMLAACAKGIGTCWVEWTKNAEQDRELISDLGITDDYMMVAPIAMGYPAEIPETPARMAPHVLKLIK
jgi:nitroreductase